MHNDEQMDNSLRKTLKAAKELINGKPDKEEIEKEFWKRKKEMKNFYNPAAGKRDYPIEVVRRLGANQRIHKDCSDTQDKTSRIIKELPEQKNPQGESLKCLAARQDKTTGQANNDYSRTNVNTDFSLHDIVEYFQTPFFDHATGEVTELVGMEDLAVLSTLCYVNDLSFGIEGDSGSGKTMLMDIWETLVQEDYIKLSQASSKSLFGMKESLEKKNWLYVSELQKIAASNSASKGLAEMLKDFTEGKESSYDCYVSRNKSERIKLKPMNVVYTRAVTNSWNMDPELRRRFMVFKTDSSNEYTQRVNEKTLENWLKIGEKNHRQTKKNEQLKNYVQALAGQKGLRYIDPFAMSFAEVIKDIPGSTSFIPKYGNLLRASAKFNLNKRNQILYNNDRYIILDLDDHYNVHSLYHRHFLETMNSWNDQIQNNTAEIDWNKYLDKAFYTLNNSENLNVLRENFSSVLERWKERHKYTNITDYKTGRAIQYET